MACPGTAIRFLTVGELARRSGVAVSAIHFYEAKGLIRSERSEGNQRRFPRGTLRRVAIIKVAQRTGIPLAEIKRTLDAVPSDRRLTAEEWSGMAASWKAELDKRIARLQGLRDQLGDCIGCGCLSMESCPLRNPDDQLGQQGAGPRLLDPA